MLRTLAGCLALLVISLPAWADAARPAGGELLGRTIENFELRDFRGKPHALADYSDSQAVVVYFLGTECPLAKLYAPRVQRLSAEFAQRDVTVLGINSNVQDSLTELEHHVRVHGIEFPVLKDVGNQVADEFGATRTPQVFVLDKDRRVVYAGRVDGQYTFGSGVGSSSPSPKRDDLRIALEELLAGKPIAVAATEAKGCLIGRVREARTSDITYSKQIARIFQQHCVECHRQGKIAPFAMTNYEEVAGWGEMIREVVQQQRMPPWHANPAHGRFANEARLSDTEKQQIYAWVDAGCPAGDPADLPAPKQYHEGWYLPREPDQIVYMTDEEVDVKAEGTEPYRYYTVDPGFTEDKWVAGAEALPGNTAVVHHIIVFVRPPSGTPRDHGDSRMLVIYGPGTRPMPSRKGWARRVPAGSKLVFQMHYTPIGTPQKDRSMCGLIFCDESEVTHRTVTTNSTNGSFVIPPHASDHSATSEQEFERDTILMSLFPHMHLRGKSFRYELTYPDGRHEVLLDVPLFDFNWQNHYILREPKLIPKGAKLVCTSHWDNSADNLANPDPSQEVRWGDQSWEEMHVGWYEVAFPKTKTQPRDNGSCGD